MTEWLDISSSQTIVDYAKLKSKIDGIIIKLGFTGYGTNKPAFSDGWKTHFNNLKDKGIDLGVYYFTIAYTEEMVDLETDWVIKQLKEAEKTDLDLHFLYLLTVKHRRILQDGRIFLKSAEVS